MYMYIMYMCVDTVKKNTEPVLIGSGYGDVDVNAEKTKLIFVLQIRPTKCTHLMF